MDSTASSRSGNEATAEKFGVKAHNPGESDESKKAELVQPEIKAGSSSKTKESTSTPPSAKKPSYMDSTASSRSRNEATAEKFGVKAHNPGESGGAKKAGSVQSEVKGGSSSTPPSPPPSLAASEKKEAAPKREFGGGSTSASRSRNAETNEAHKDKFEKRGVGSHHTGEDKMGTLSKDKAAASAGAGTKAGSSSTAKGPTASSTKPAATKSSATSSKPTAPTSNAKAGGTPPPSGGKAASGGKARVGVADATTKASEAGKREKAPVSPPEKPAPKPIKL
jgi:hypothetical protein